MTIRPTIQDIMSRLDVTETQVHMAYYSGALPKTINPEPFLQHWDTKLKARRAAIKPKTSIYDEPIF